MTFGTVYIALVCTPKLLSSGLFAFPSSFSPSVLSFTTTLLQPINVYVEMLRNVSSHNITATRSTRKLDVLLEDSLSSFYKFSRSGTEIPMSGVIHMPSHLYDSVSHSLPFHMGNYYPLAHISRVLTSSVWGVGSHSDSSSSSSSSSHGNSGFASAWIEGCDAFLRATHLKENLPDETLLLFFVAVICIGTLVLICMQHVCMYVCMYVYMRALSRTK